MSRPTLIAGLVVLLVAAGAFAGFRAFSAGAADDARELRERRQRDRDTARSRELDALAESLREGSRDKFPPPLEGLSLGMTESELRELRPNIQLKTDGHGPGTWFEERLADNAQALYAFGEQSERLGQVQVLSVVAPEGIGPHLTALVERYGSPTGIWHCPGSGPDAMATRRFTWHMEDVSVQDVVLVHPRGVSVTFYIAPTEVIGQSLQLSACRPVRSREEMAQIPVATPDQLPEIQR